MRIISTFLLLVGVGTACGTSLRGAAAIRGLQAFAGQLNPRPAGGSGSKAAVAGELDPAHKTSDEVTTESGQSKPAMAGEERPGSTGGPSIYEEEKQAFAGELHPGQNGGGGVQQPDKQAFAGVLHTAQPDKQAFAGELHPSDDGGSGTTAAGSDKQAFAGVLRPGQTGGSGTSQPNKQAFAGELKPGSSGGQGTGV